MPRMTTTLLAIESAMETLGEFDAVMRGEPKNAPQNNTLAILLDAVVMEHQNLATPTEIRSVILRHYLKALGDEAATEEASAGAYDAILGAIGGDLDLSTFGGGETGVAEPDMDSLTAQWGYLTLDSTIYRTFDVSLGYRVHGAVDYVR